MVSEVQEKPTAEQPAEPRWVSRARRNWFIGSAIAVSLVLLTGSSIAANWVTICTTFHSCTAAVAKDKTPKLEVLTPGWSPVRKAWSTHDYPTAPTLNSVSDYPSFGSEFAFTRVRRKENAYPDGVFTSTANAYAGDEVEVSIMVSNDAGINMQTGDDVTIHNTQAAVETKTGSNGALVTAWIKGDNADQVESGALVSSEGPIKLIYEKGSATFMNSSGEHAVGNEIGEGAWKLLGSEELNGDMRVGKNPNTGKNYDVGWLSLTYYVEAG
jgi:hypothetical protein